MTPQEKKEIVRSVIINAVPNFPSHISVLNKNDKTTEIDVINSRPITLADVLIAIDKKIGIQDTYYTVSMNGEIYKEDRENNIHAEIAFWNLSQDFDHQSEETIDFLWSLLCE